MRKFLGDTLVKSFPIWARLTDLLVNLDDIAHLLLQAPKLFFKVFQLTPQHLNAFFTLFNCTLEFPNSVLILLELFFKFIGFHTAFIDLEE